MPKQPVFLLIDGNSLMHRAFHAIPPLSNSQGEMLNAVYGFTMILMNVLKRFEPAWVAVTFDLHAPTFRHVEYAEYKAHRPPTDPGLVPQFDRVRDVVQALRIPIFEIEGYEADDVIGTLSRLVPAQAKAFGDTAVPEVLIVTGDLDTLQLVDEHTRVFTSKRKLTDEVIYDRERVIERYGFGPEYVIDYKALRGDPSDNIPGVDGIGEKTATELVLKFGHLEQMYALLESDPAQMDISEKLKDKLRTQRDQAFLSYRLSTIVCDVPISFDFNTCRFELAQAAEARPLFRELEFRSLVNLVSEPVRADIQPVAASSVPAAPAGQMSLFAIPGTAVPQAPVRQDIPETRSKVPSTLEEVTAYVDAIRSSGLVVLDTETTSLDYFAAELVGISFAVKPDEAVYLPFGHQDGPNLDRAAVLALLKPVLEDSAIRKVGHNLKFDMLILKNQGIEVGGCYFDTMLAAYLLHPGLRAYGLKDLAFSELGWEMTRIESLIGIRKSEQVSFGQVPLEQAYPYACADVLATYQLYEIFLGRLRAGAHPEKSGVSDLETLFFTLEMPLVPVLTEMEYAGISIDEQFLSRMSVELGEEIKVQENAIIGTAGHFFNVNSPAQLSTVLFTEMGIKKTKRTKTGFSTDADSLEKIREENPIVQNILAYRELAKLKSTYVDALPPLVRPQTGRIHTSYNQAVAATGRLSSSNPNLQNIPTRTPLGNEIRKAFVAAEGHVLLSSDYSQVEFRILAHMAQDAQMIEAFKSGVDFHTSTAARVFNVYPEQVTKEQRSSAKTVNFGILYGQSKYGLSKQLGISQDEAEAFIQAFFQGFPEVGIFLEKIKVEARTKGYVSTLLGRIRQIPEINSPSPMEQQAAERMAVNMPIQGTAADILKIAMIAIHQDLGAQGLMSKMILQVHDELVLEVPDSEIERVQALVGDRMEHACRLQVPLKVDIAFGRSWGAMHDV